MEKAHTGAKDFFLWAGAMLFLYSSIVAFITLLFSYINYAFPDALNNYASNPYDSGMSYQMAVLIVLAPAFFALMRLIRRDIKKDPTRADLWVRKWALYLTLFVAGVTMAVDLITLLYFFLSGQDITVRFILKVAIVLLVGSAAFMHFLADVWGYWIRYPERSRWVEWAAGALVVLSIAAGFLIVGTPWDARHYRLDEQKVNDLQNIQSQIITYWQQKDKLPATLSDLNDTLSYETIPTDPQTNAAYEYTATASESFSLCATFNAASQANAANGAVAEPMIPAGAAGVAQDNWAHSAGHVCFARTIDPERYPPFNSKQ